MAIYRDHVLPRLVDKTCGVAAIEPQRRRVCTGLAGEVLEIGFGSGHDVPHYPAEVTRVRAVEPSDLAWRLAGERVAASPVPVERAGLDGQRLDLADESVDAVLVAFSLCTIPDALAALGEMRRVLRADGRVHFLEHGLAPDGDVRRWQRRIEPIQKRLAGGCHLTREPVAMLEQAGFAIVEVEEFYQPDTPRPMGALSLGVARR